MRLKGAAIRAHPRAEGAILGPNSSVARGRGERGEISPPLPDPGGPFLIRTIKFCNLLLSNINENKQFTFFGGPMLGLQGSILTLRVLG